MEKVKHNIKPSYLIRTSCLELKINVVLKCSKANDIKKSFSKSLFKIIIVILRKEKMLHEDPGLT